MHGGSTRIDRHGMLGAKVGGQTLLQKMGFPAGRHPAAFDGIGHFGDFALPNDCR
jgi:hypothetical protein